MILIFFTFNNDGRNLGFIFCFNYHFFAVTCLLISFFTVSKPSITFSNFTVPLISATITLLNGSHVQITSPLFTFCPSFTIQCSTIRNVIGDQQTVILYIHDTYFTCTPDYTCIFIAFIIFGIYCTQSIKLNSTIKLRYECRFY